MLPVFLALLLGTLGYLWWKYRVSGLTRNCRWREDRSAGDWVCAYCGARAAGAGGKPPRLCRAEG